MDNVHRYFATTVGLVTSHHDGNSDVMACEWTMCVSWNPLKILIMVWNGHLTNEYIKASGEFGVSLCSDQLAAQSHLAGSVSGKSKDKLADDLFKDRLYPATKIKAPMIESCIVNAECEVKESFVLGDYTGFIGQAVEAKFDEDLKPLFYHQGKYFFMGNQVPKS